MANGHNSSRKSDFQDVQERVAARKAARAEAREARLAQESVSSQRTARMRAGRARSAAPVPASGGMPPQLISYDEAHGPNPLIIGLVALAAIVMLVFLVGHVRGCLDRHQYNESHRIVPVSQLSPGTMALVRSELGARTHTMPLFEAPRTNVVPVDASSLDGLIVDGLPVSYTTAQSLFAVHPNYETRVSPILQLPNYESGCEVTSLAVILRSMGCPVSVEDLIGCLVMNGSFSQGFAGSVYGDGGSFPRGMVKAANAYAQRYNASVRGHDLTGSSFESLLALVQAGYPVMVWTTMYMEDYYPSEDVEWHHTWYWNEHVVVLYGVRNGELLVADPLEGAMVRNLQAFQDIYETCGRMGLLVTPF